MTSNACACRSLELSSHVAGGAIQVRVGSSKRKPRHLQVVKFRPLPGIERGVALLTGGREAHRPMVGRCGVQVGGDVAADTVGR